MKFFYYQALSTLTALLFISTAYSQYQVNTLNAPQVIDFDGFTGDGFTPNPAAGELNSEEWEVLGMSDGDLFFGETGTTGDYARGLSTGGVTTGGVYSFDVGTGNGVSLGVQPGGNDFTDGSFTLRIQNNTVAPLEDISISYDVWILNDQDRANNFNFEHGSDNITFTQEPSLDLNSDEVASTDPQWEQNTRTITLVGVNLQIGEVYYLKWTGNDVSGTGSRDEFALDNISITGINPNTIITASPNELTGFLQTIGNPSSEQTFEVSAANLTEDLVLTLTNADYEISTNSGAGFTNTITLIPVTGEVEQTTIYVRLNGNTAANPSLGAVELNSVGAAQETVTLEGKIQPVGSGVINATPNQLTGFVQALGSPSPEQTFEVTASSLSDDLVLTVTAGAYEISDISGAGFGTTLTIKPINGEVPATDIFVRLNGTAVSNPEDGTIELASIGTNSVLVTLEGEIKEASNPIITVNPTELIDFEQLLGSPSGEQTFEVSGSDLSDNINLTVTGDYEISLTTGIDYTNTLTVPQTGGVVGATTIYVRLNGTLEADPSLGEVTVSSPQATSQVVTLEGVIIDGCNIDTSVDQVDFVLTSNATGVDYQWVDCTDNFAYIAGENNQTFEPEVNGTYAVILTQDAQCVDTSECIIVEGLNTEDFALSKVKAYPNPVSEELTIELGNATIDFAHVYTPSGALILELQKINSNTLFINTSSWKNGVYFVKVGSEVYSKTLKIIK